MNVPSRQRGVSRGVLKVDGVELTGQPEGDRNRLCDGDALVAWKLDRLGRGGKNLVGVVFWLISGRVFAGRLRLVGAGSAALTAGMVYS